MSPETPIVEPEFTLTISTAARLLETSEGWIRTLANSGRLPSRRTSTGARLFRPADLQRLRAERVARRAR